MIPWNTVVFGYRGHSYQANVDLPCRGNSYHALFFNYRKRANSYHALFFNYRNRAAQNVALLRRYRGFDLPRCHLPNKYLGQYLAASIADGR